MTKTTACSAAPLGTPHPQWSAFLDRITAGDAELQDFLQRYIGYCCTGLTTEHAFVFAYGTGANGKSTFINTIARIFGDYATVADMATFIASSTERHPTDLAKLRGARLVVAQETQKGRRWDEVRIKALTGGDRLTARFMRQDFFDFAPTFKLFIAGNHKPRLGSSTKRCGAACCWCRSPSGYRLASVILHWPRSCGASARRSCAGASTAACSGSGTGSRRPPASATPPTNTSGARTRFGEWLEDAIEDADDRAFTRMSALFASWKGWCEERNIKPGSTMALSGMLEDRGYEKRRESRHGPPRFRSHRRQKAMSRDRAGDRFDRYSGYPRHARARVTSIIRRTCRTCHPDEFRTGRSPATNLKLGRRDMIQWHRNDDEAYICEHTYETPTGFSVEKREEGWTAVKFNNSTAFVIGAAETSDMAKVIVEQERS